MSKTVPLTLGVCTGSTSCIYSGNKKDKGEALLSPRVPKVRHTGPSLPVIFREICSVILGSCKLEAGSISVRFI